MFFAYHQIVGNCHAFRHILGSKRQRWGWFLLEIMS